MENLKRNDKKTLHCEYCGYDNNYFLASMEECTIFWSDEMNEMLLTFECKNCGARNGRLITGIKCFDS